MNDRSFRTILIRCLLKPAFLFLCVAIYVIPVNLTMPHDLHMVDPESHLSAADDTVAGLMLEQHHCWRENDTHPDVIPSHAIVELDLAKGPQLVSSKIGFGIWLEGKPGTLYAFCP